MAPEGQGRQGLNCLAPSHLRAGVRASGLSPCKAPGLDLWVRAINQRGGFGNWCWDVVKGGPAKVADVLTHHAALAQQTDPIGEVCL